MQVTAVHNQAATMAAAAKKIISQPADDFAICPVRDVMDRIGDKWSLLVILQLGAAEHTMRFNELRRHIAGVSQRMLTVTLRSLETDGLVARTVYAEVPPRVEYCLTPLGYSLLEAVVALGNWASAHAPAIAAARQRHAAVAA
jgi:DNA-binding HxlR family transcriptional regulator